MGNMIGPVIAPTLGGEVSDHYGWQWAYWMIVPVAAVTAIGFQLILPKRETREHTRLDWSGFLTLSIAIAGAQIVFSRGQRLDWFESTEIVVSTFLTMIALYMFVVSQSHDETPVHSVVPVRRSQLCHRHAVGVLLRNAQLRTCRPVAAAAAEPRQLHGLGDRRIHRLAGAWYGDRFHLRDDISEARCPPDDDDLVSRCRPTAGTI